MLDLKKSKILVNLNQLQVLRDLIWVYFEFFRYFMLSRTMCGVDVVIL